MRPNKIIEKWNAGQAAVNIFLSTPGSFTAEVMASLGWDGVTIDMQHGVNDYSDLLPMMKYNSL